MFQFQAKAAGCTFNSLTFISPRVITHGDLFDIKSHEFEIDLFFIT